MINFVALMEGCREKDAAQKLADWYGIAEAKNPAHGRGEKKPKTNLQKDYQDDSPSAVAVKYMAWIDLWFDETFKPVEGEDDSSYWARVGKSVKSKLGESFRAGQKK